MIGSAKIQNIIIRNSAIRNNFYSFRERDLIPCRVGCLRPLALIFLFFFMVFNKIVFLRAKKSQMEKVYFTDYVPSSRGAAREKLTQWQKKYPASAFLNIFCLKEARMKLSHRQRSKMLLTLPDKLRFDSLQLETAPVVEVREKPQLNMVENRPHISSPLHPIFVKHPTPDHENRQVLIDQLIEKFSKDAPKIIYSPDVHDADADYGIESSIEDQSIVSVSLANIYADQGYYDRAIQMFEILKLHFPEKNSIFAARIEELKKMMAEG